VRRSDWLPPVAELPSGTVTFLFTDVEGSTRLLKRLGERYGDVLDAHRAILRAAFAESNGQEIDTQGDSFFVVFRRAKDAIAAAVEGQRRLAAHPWPDGAELRVRMGVHTGEPVVGPDRYIGLAVVRGARIMAAGHGGQILVSGATRELVEDDLGPGISLRDLSDHRLKDLDRPERLFQVVADRLANEFPPLRTEEAPTAYSGLEEELTTAAQAVVGRSPRDSRRLLMFGLGGLIVAASAAAVVVFGTGSSSHAGPPAEPNSAIAMDERTGKIIGSVPVGSGPVRVAAGGGALWVANGDAGTVTRIDPVSRTTVRIDVGSAPAGIAFGDNAVWVADGADGTLSRINADTNRVVAKISDLLGPRGVAFGEGAVWVATLDDRSVTRVDAATGLVKTIPTGGTPNAIAVGAGSVWVTNEAGSSVLQISPETGTVIKAINVGNGPGAIAVGFGSVWVANTLDGTVSRIDAKTGRAVALVVVGEGPRDITVGRDAVWVANEFSGTVSRIDARTSIVTATTATGSRPTGLALANAAVWVTVRPGGGAHRGGTFTVASRSNAIDSIDPARSYSSASWQILSLTGDGLTAFRRVGGSEGAIVVPDLATDLPTVTDGGRTYTFHLRRGIRYSTGAVVEPRDIRATLERGFEVGVPVDYYSKIVGASDCRKRRRCDLSQGVVITGDTIVFHLTAPDPEFPQRLALPFAYVLPSSTPRRATGTRPLPSTGPYAIVRYDPKRQLELKRNPHFHEWSPAARPDGYPDAIVIRFGVSNDAATTAVERGRLDYAPGLPAGRINEVATRYADQLHTNPLSETNTFVMNTRIAPFDSQAARRAVSYAIDRSELVRLGGSPQSAQPTCQILPTNFPGYEPYCPFTLLPTSAGVWRGPDLAKARTLVARSHTRGMRVTVLTDGYNNGLRPATYLVRLLDRLGYKASRKTIPYSSFGSLAFSGSRSDIQVALVEWIADYPSAGTFIRPSLSCRGPTNDAGFCDPKLDREMAAAERLGATDARAAEAQWAHIDRELVDAAPWIPYATGKALDFVSKRVGNFQFNPEWGMLFDQLWVR
jgi:peptide/nickel transport system substrate-binding protein